MFLSGHRDDGLSHF